MIKDGLTFDINIITIGIDFYSLYMAEKKRKLVDGIIKYFRIGLNYINIGDLESICKIYISYVKNGEKQLSLFDKI